MRLRRPVRWIEDRREHLTGGANCREHHYDITGYAAADGTLLGVECEAIVDSGAYSAYPFSACLEAAQVGQHPAGALSHGGLPLPHLVGVHQQAADPAVSRRRAHRRVLRHGVGDGRAGAGAGHGAVGVPRCATCPAPEAMPFTNITGKFFDSGDYPEALRRAVAAIDVPAVRARQQAGEPDGRLIGVGLSIFCEQGAHGTTVYAGWGIPDRARASSRRRHGSRPDGGLEIRVGVHSHGQGLETTLAQVAHEVLGVAPARVRRGAWRYGADALFHRHLGVALHRHGRRRGGGGVPTFWPAGSARIAAAPAAVPSRSRCALADGLARGPAGEVTLAEVARLWYRTPQHLPAGIDPAGLEVTGGYKPLRDSGTFSYACHAAVVAVDPTTGGVSCWTT